jgi:DNA repair protein RadC
MMLNLPDDERPRERLLSKGAEALSLAELLAVILGSGVKGKCVLTLASELLETFGSPSRLLEASVHELLQIEGIGPARALQLKAAFAFSLRALALKEGSREVIASPSDAFCQLRPHLWGKRCEEFYVLMRDARGRAIAVEQVSKGSLAQVTAHPRELFGKAITRSAQSVIIAHNHPSGDCTPWAQDLTHTQRLSAAGRILNIPLDDHIILAGGQFLSFYDRGYFEPRKSY